MRTMLDSTTATDLPAGADLYLGYLDGSFANYSAVANRFPDKRIVSVTVLGGHTAANMCDCEAGDLTPETAHQWVLNRRAEGYWPTIYCLYDGLLACRKLFDDNGQERPPFVVALYDGIPDLTYGMIQGRRVDITGVIGKQHSDPKFTGHHYDESIVADVWPGVDPPQAPSNTPIPTEDIMDISGAASWFHRQGDGAHPRFRAHLDGADTIVTSIDNAQFSPAFAPGDHGAYVDYTTAPQYGSLWCRRFKNGGLPTGWGEDAAEGVFYVIADHGTFDLARKA